MSRAKRLALIAAAALLGGCQSLPPAMTSWMPSMPDMSSIPILTADFWGIKSNKPGPLPPFDAKTTAKINWQIALGGKAKTNFVPAALGDSIYAAGADGTVIRVDAASGKEAWRIKNDKPLQSGVGVSSGAIVVGTDKGDVIAFDAGGKPLWKSKVSTEVAGPPKIVEGKVIVWALDGKIVALSEADGTQKWLYTGTMPALTVRRFVGGSVARGAMFTGTAGGKLLAFDINTGNLGWQANVATSKGSNELERIADVTSLPVIDAKQVCAVAFQGRVACFDVLNGNLIWSRDFSSLAGITVDDRYLYLTDDKGSVHALDKVTGASMWKQDKLARRFPGGPMLIGNYLGIIDAEGFLHILDRDTGNLIGRIATDGTPTQSQPIAVGDSAVWQSVGGNLISASAR